MCCLTKIQWVEVKLLSVLRKVGPRTRRRRRRTTTTTTTPSAREEQILRILRLQKCLIHLPWNVLFKSTSLIRQEQLYQNLNFKLFCNPIILQKVWRITVQSEMLSKMKITLFILLAFRKLDRVIKYSNKESGNVSCFAQLRKLIKFALKIIRRSNQC